MCDVGRGDWLFTDSPACYVATDTRFRQCICPFATCTRTTKGYGCRITTSVTVLAGFLVAVWLLAGVAYIYLSNYIGMQQLEARAERESLQGAQYFYKKLFGSGSPTSSQEICVDVAVTEKTALLAERAA